MFLAKYKKPGGFLQLIQLVEASPPSAQQKIMRMIAAEDPGWALLVQKKMLKVDRVLTWPTWVLEKVFSEIPTFQIAHILQAAQPHLRDRVYEVLGAKQAEVVKGELAKIPLPSEDQIHAAVIKLMQGIRSLEGRRLIRFEEFDESVLIDKRLIA